MARARTSRLRWYIATLLFLATVINYVDRQALSVAIPVIRDQYHMTNTDYSRIVTAFLLAYTIMQVASGRLIDWLGTRVGLALFVTWWSAAGILHSLANGVWGFAAFRFLLGMGEAGSWPGCVKAISEWFPARERGLAAGFFNSGSSLGALLAPPLISWIVLRFGWRQAFILTGVLGFAWLVAWLALYEPPEKHPRITAEELRKIREPEPGQAAEASPLAWRSLFRYRQLWALILGRILTDPVWWFYVFWLPEYLKRQRNFSMEMIGMFAWIPFLAADIGNFIGGGGSSLLIRSGWSVDRARKTVILASAASMAAGIPAALTSSAPVCVALISLATLSYSAFAANIITLPTDIFPRQIMASVYGISGTAAGIGGMAFTLITGRVVDKVSYTPIFVTAGLLPIIAATIVVLVVGRIQPIAVESDTVGQRG